MVSSGNNKSVSLFPKGIIKSLDFTNVPRVNQHFVNNNNISNNSNSDTFPSFQFPFSFIVNILFLNVVNNSTRSSTICKYNNKLISTYRIDEESKQEIKRQLPEEVKKRWKLYSKLNICLLNVEYENLNAPPMNKKVPIMIAIKNEHFLVARFNKKYISQYYRSLNEVHSFFKTQNEEQQAQRHSSDSTSSFDLHNKIEYPCLELQQPTATVCNLSTPHPVSLPDESFSYFPSNESSDFEKSLVKKARDIEIMNNIETMMQGLSKINDLMRERIEEEEYGDNEEEEEGYE